MGGCRLLRGFYTGAALLLVQAGLVNSPAAAGGSAVLQWLQIALSAASLAMIIFASLKVINRNNEEWRDRERRMVALEQELLELRKEGKDNCRYQKNGVTRLYLNDFR